MIFFLFFVLLLAEDVVLNDDKTVDSMEELIFNELLDFEVSIK